MQLRWSPRAESRARSRKWSRTTLVIPTDSADNEADTLSPEAFMRATGLLLLLTAFVGICVAQDTNFPVGPQYLITTNSTLFLRPIGTPSLSFEPMPAAPAVATQSASSTPSTEAYLPSVYWGER